MCNYKREDSYPIPHKGKGFKIVQISEDIYWPPFGNHIFNKHNIWDDAYKKQDDSYIYGFCFCNTFSEVSELLSSLKESLTFLFVGFKIVEIYYEKRNMSSRRNTSQS